MVENKVAQSIKANLIDNGYVVVYSENTGRIFGYDILKKDFGYGNTAQVIVRNHMVSVDVSDKTMRVVHHTSFESIADHEEFVSLIADYFGVIAGIYGRETA